MILPLRIQLSKKSNSSLEGPQKSHKDEGALRSDSKVIQPLHQGSSPNNHENSNFKNFSFYPYFKEIEMIFKIKEKNSISKKNSLFSLKKCFSPLKIH